MMIAPTSLTGQGEADLTVGYFLRDWGNLHYFASIKPYLDKFLRRPGVRNYVIVRPGSHERGEALPELRDYAHLLTSGVGIDDCDLVLTPTFLRPDDRPGPHNPRTRVVQIFHGMSDKPFTYDRDFSNYALCLCAGLRQLERLRANPSNRVIKTALVGYPKFDTVVPAAHEFGNGRPTLIYCPTWRKGGLSSIERFLGHETAVAELAQRFNILVKPHPNIFNPSRQYFDPEILDRLRQLDRLPGVRVVRSGNAMAWFAQADVFLGDVSAVGYEWLYFNRPMVFLNPQPDRLRASRDVQAPTFLWQCGSVCDDLGEVGDAAVAALFVDRHGPDREEILHYSVHCPRDGKATERGLAAIMGLLERGLERAGA